MINQSKLSLKTNYEKIPHELPKNPSLHMHSPSWQVPPWLQSTFRHIFSLSRVISTEAVTMFCWHRSSSFFKSANLSQSFSCLPSPVHGLPPQLCSFFSLMRNTFEIWHSSGQADHSPHSSQVQSTATFLKQKLHINNPLVCQEIQYTYDSSLGCTEMNLFYQIPCMPCHHLLRSISHSLTWTLSQVLHMF